MFSFGSRNTFLGIDIGTSAIKVVEIKVVGGKPVLSNYAWLPLSSNVQQESGSEYYYVFLAECLKRMIKESGISTRDAYASLPSVGGLITIIDFPEMAAEEMEQAVRYEAHKYIPTAMEDVVLSWEVAGMKNDHAAQTQTSEQPQDVVSTSQPNKIQVLLVAASKNRVIRYEEMIKKADLKLKSLELENFSMINSLIGNDPGNYIIVDIGASVCNIILVERGMVRITRSIDAGGKQITEAIVRSMGIDEERAERIKESGKNFFAKDSYMNFPALDIIIGETGRIIDKYYPHDQIRNLGGIILSGGIANLTGIGDYFSESLGTKAIVGNPMSRLTYDPQLEPVMKKIGTRFAVAIGAALKGANKVLEEKNRK